MQDTFIFKYDFPPIYIFLQCVAIVPKFSIDLCSTENYNKQYKTFSIDIYLSYFV